MAFRAPPPDLARQVLSREAWNALQHEVIGEREGDADATVRLSTDGVYVERFDGRSDVSVYGSEKATDIRIGRAQLIASKGRLILLSHAAGEWFVLYDGPIVPA